ncbi:hypothetical protein MF1_11170 [Bartonella quintana]|uniref:hypothetical protein n=1 Tax=Bartonella quintana TaxID=803 RepID=UPI001316F6EC|nr:hypothetical protein [Bartonella quintana]BBL53859.1 hypothetical protein MF1_11170 [Bartonella quintana]
MRKKSGEKKKHFGQKNKKIGRKSQEKSQFIKALGETIVGTEKCKGLCRGTWKILSKDWARDYVGGLDEGSSVGKNFVSKGINLLIFHHKLSISCALVYNQ